MPAHSCGRVLIKIRYCFQSPCLEPVHDGICEIVILKAFNRFDGRGEDRIHGFFQFFSGLLFVQIQCQCGLDDLAQLFLILIIRRQISGIQIP